MRGYVTAVVFVVACCGIGAAALGDRQARDPGGALTGQVPAAGSAIIRGIVLTDASDSQPVRRATVRLAGDTGSLPRIAGTDDEGRFVFAGLRAGRYTVSASRAGFVTAFHGSTRPGRGPGVPVAVADGQKSDVQIRMTRGAVITGVITDPRGNPAPSVSVAAVDTRAPASPVRVTTDDRGVYRIFGLAAGEYLVSASPAPEVGRIGSAGPVTRVTDAEVQWARNFNPAAGQTVAPPARDTRPVNYAPVFYPGTTDVSAAATVRVAAGQERPGVDVSMRLVSLARVAGTIVDMNGQPVSSAIVTIVPRRGDRPSPADALLSSGVLPMPRASVGPSGFTFTGVAPGQYTIVARTGSMQRGAPPPDPNSPPTQWALVDLDVDGSDRADIALRLLPGVTVTGSISFDGAAPRPMDVAAVDLSFIAVNVIPGLPATFRATVAADGSFRLPGLAPGNYLIRAAVAGAAGLTPTDARWTLSSAMAGQRDLADRPLAVVPGGPEVTGVLVAMTSRAAEISGRVIDPGNLPVTRYSIVVVSTETAMWVSTGRRVRLVQPATDGSFVVSALPPGEYAIAAVENLDAENLANEDLLSRVVQAAPKVTVAEGEKKRMDLKVGG